MYEIVKSINETTKLAINGNTVYILKKVNLEDLELYRKLAKINNPNVVKIYDQITLLGSFYVVEDFVQGITLEEYVVRNHPLSDEKIKEIVYNICNGLADIHRLGIVHRDITPTNIMIDSNDNPIIIDFGISRLQKPSKEADTQILGTHGFAAPEQYGFSQTNERADIYSIGVLINYMKTLKMPNEAMATSELQPIIKKCIEIDETKRFENISKLQNALQHKKLEGFIRSIPGFRQGVGWHILVACIYYLTALLFMYMMTDIYSGIKNITFGFCVVIFGMLVPVPIMLNYNNWINKWSFTKKLTNSGKLAIKIISSVISLIIACVFIILLPS